MFVIGSCLLGRLLIVEVGTVISSSHSSCGHFMHHSGRGCWIGRAIVWGRVTPSSNTKHQHQATIKQQCQAIIAPSNTTKQQQQVAPPCNTAKLQHKATTTTTIPSNNTKQQHQVTMLSYFTKQQHQATTPSNNTK